ncbi:MAG: hypothetical protein K8R21_13605, partial [Leptospira sp.]|nr:hypothetical protein [Leptospira sp.]
TVDTYTYSDANAPSFPSKLVSVATTTGVATPVTTTSTMTYNANRFAATKTVSCANTATTGTVNTTWTYDEMNRLTKTVISTPADCAAPGAAATTRTIASTFDGTTYDLLTTSNGLDDNNKTVTTFSGYTRDGAKTLTVTASAVTTTAGVAGNPVVTTTTNTFTDGKLTTQVSAITGGTTTTTKYTYNAAGKLSSSAAALSTGASSAASYTYDSANRLTGATSSSTNAAGVTTTNNSISATYTASGALDTMVSTPNAGTAVITTTFAN